MQTAIIEIINKFGYLGIVSLITIEILFPPIPSEVILTFGGFATTISNITVIGVIIASTVGSVIGAVILYLLGRVLSVEKLEKFSESKFGKILGLEKADIEKSVNWFDSKGKYAVFFGRFIPIIRSLVSVPAGMAKMAMLPFLILTTIGSLIWNTVLVVLGRIAGDSWNVIAMYVGGYSDIVLILFMIVFVLGIMAFYIKKSGRIKIMRFRKNKYSKKLE